MPARVAGGLLAVFFIYAAIVQLNDVDALQWFFAYALAALLSALLIFKIRVGGMMLGLAVGALGCSDRPDVDPDLANVLDLVVGCSVELDDVER